MRLDRLHLSLLLYPSCGRRLTQADLSLTWQPLPAGAPVLLVMDVSHMYTHALHTPVHKHVRARSIDACGCHLRRRYFAEELDAAAAVDCYARLRGEPCPNFPHGKAARSLTLQEVSCDVIAIDCSRRHGLAVGMSQRNRNLNHMTKPVSC